jgi:hypothetical protein
VRGWARHWAFIHVTPICKCRNTQLGKITSKWYLLICTLSPVLEIWFLVSPKHSLEDNFVRGTVPQTVSVFPLGIFFSIF